MMDTMRDQSVEPHVFVILGATGAVGQEFVQLLSERRWPADRLRLVASAQSADRQITYLEQNLIVERLAVFQASSEELRPIGNGWNGIGRFRKQSPQ